jgi:uncharacterized protein
MPVKDWKMKIMQKRRVDPHAVISTYYKPGSMTHHILTEHSRMVALKAVEVAGHLRHLNPDVSFIEEAAMLHDIGIFMTREPRLGCHGDRDYICHGYLGRELLEREGLPLHALVCERHVGAGITVRDIDEGNLPIPRREMIPLSLEEKIICFADKFFSKRPERLREERPLEEVRKQIARYGQAQLKRFEEMVRMFRR